METKELALSFLPVGGSAITYDAWLSAINGSGNYSARKAIQPLRRSGEVLFEFDEQGDHVVRRNLGGE